ncbi:MAG: polysaccharide biosynthesis protein [Clostridia bacterium]|nr:polysaccharide biosynthesis protein [Clostridia bacterium]
MLAGKVLLITGGTGSFGNTVLKHYLNSDIGEIRIFSRDEKKQDDMRKALKNEKVRFYIGDVRNIHSVREAMKGADYVFHAAALKQVPSCEFFPMEAVLTNVHGTDHVLSAAIDAGVKRVICLSTDKAAYPINAMGISKAMMEKVASARAREAQSTVICCTRYGNVMGSRGSVIPLFMEQILARQPLTVTDPCMTRFLMTLDEAVKLVHFAFEQGRPGELFVQKTSACTMDTLVKAVCQLFGVPDHPIHVIGSRHGEKLYETLLTREERIRGTDQGDYFSITAETRDLNYDKYFLEGDVVARDIVDYTSHNTHQLSVEQVTDKLLSLEIIHAKLAGRKDYGR